MDDPTIAKLHQDLLREQLADNQPDSAELAAFCGRAGIDMGAGIGSLSVEDCACISAWIQLPDIRARAELSPWTVVDINFSSPT